MKNDPFFNEKPELNDLLKVIIIGDDVLIEYVQRLVQAVKSIKE